MRLTRISLIALFAAAMLASLTGAATAQRDVLLNVCNDTGFSVAIAAAYRTTPSENRTLRSWFLVEPAACLQGAVNNVVGDSVDLHVMSGEWRWPARAGDAVYCTPANSTFALATGAPCRGGQEARTFVRLPVMASRHRGVGQADYRVRCSDLTEPDADLCVGAPRDERGLAQIVRTLEVCQTGQRDSDAVVLVSRPDGGFEIAARQTVPAAGCADIYRGFPLDQTILVGGVGDLNDDAIGRFCLTGDDQAVVQAAEDGCGEAAWITPERHVFRSNVSRFTAFLR